MWVFLVNETIFFGALVFTYFLYRWSYPHEFDVAAKDAVLWCGSVNFGLLLTSSLTMVLAVNAAAQGRRRDMIWWLVATMVLGCLFLGVKGFEYYLDYTDKVVPVVHYEAKPGEGRAGELFWIFYWVATGLHAIHLTTGIGLILYLLLWRVRRGEITPEYYAPIEVDRHLLELRRHGVALSLPLHISGGTMMSMRLETNPQQVEAAALRGGVAGHARARWRQRARRLPRPRPVAPIVQFAIAAIQTSIMFVLFMRLKDPPALKWVFGISGFFWLLFLFGLSMTDYSNRRGWPDVYYPNGPASRCRTRTAELRGGRPAPAADFGPSPRPRAADRFRRRAALMISSTASTLIMPGGIQTISPPITWSKCAPEARIDAAADVVERIKVAAT